MCFHFHFQTLIQNSPSTTCCWGSRGHGRWLWVVQPRAVGRTVSVGGNPREGSLSHIGNVLAEEMRVVKRATHSCEWFLCIPHATQQGFGSGCSLPSHQSTSDGATIGIGLEEPMPVTFFSATDRYPSRKSLLLGQSDFFYSTNKEFRDRLEGWMPLSYLS